VCFSGDKLLGGPQAGVMVGRRDAIEACKRHPLARALRIDKLSLAALEATLKLYRTPEMAKDHIPVLRMLLEDTGERAARLAELIDGEVVESTAKVGGGALPLLEIPGSVVAVEPALAPKLRAQQPAVVGRVHEGRLLLDPRTLVDDEELDLVAEAVAKARGE
jgi:L-seryl-tRNA(Ser) seleniumtransferase